MNPWKHLDSVLERFVTEGTVAGCGMTVTQNGEVLYSRCVGAASADGSRPLTEDTRLRLYSVSKTFTCAALMKLYEQGLFALDEPVAKYLPAFSNPMVCTSETDIHDVVPAKSPITIRQLLTMTSGIAYEAFDPGEGIVQQTMLKEMQALQERVYQGETIVLADIVNMIAAQPLCFHPGEHWLYGFSHAVAGRLIEVLSGKRLSDYLREEMWNPLGLTKTCFNYEVPDGEELAEQMVSAELCKPLGLKQGESPILRTGRGILYGSKRDVLPCAELGAEIPCGGITSTLHDLGIHFSMFANHGMLKGTRILGARTIDLMRANHLNPTQLEEFTQWENNRGFAYGLGYRTMQSPAKAGFYMPEGSFGWDGATGCYGLASPDRRLAVVFVEQSLPHHIVYTIPRVMAALHADMEL